MHLLGERERHAKVALAELEDLVVGSGLLFAELLEEARSVRMSRLSWSGCGLQAHVAREAKDLEPLLVVLVKQRLKTCEQ